MKWCTCSECFWWCQGHSISSPTVRGPSQVVAGFTQHLTLSPSFLLHASQVRSVAPDPFTGQWLLSGGLALPRTQLCLFLPHPPQVRSVAPDPFTGQWLLSGGDDGSVRLWEVRTGRCQATWHLGEPVACVAWCPSPALRLAAVVAGSRVVLLPTGAHRACLRVGGVGPGWGASHVLQLGAVGAGPWACGLQARVCGGGTDHCALHLPHIGW